MKHLKVLIILLIIAKSAYSQDCSQLNTRVNNDYSYSNDTEGLALPFNDEWSIILENKQAIIVALAEKNQLGFASIVKSRNGYKIDSAYDISDKMVDDLFLKAAVDIEYKVVTKTYVRNIKALQVEFDYDVRNINEIVKVKGLAYFIVKDYDTYIFMFNCQPTMRKCFFPFYKEIMKNAWFEPEWFGKNN
jgi:hypothetical protein